MPEAADPTRPLIEVNRLSKHFKGLKAVDDISFAVPRGQILGLLGPNGAGKSTTLHVLLGLTRPTSGEVLVFGRELEQHRRTILARVNFSSAYTALPTNLSVWENMITFARLYGVDRPQGRIRELLELLEIPHTLHSLTGALSSGQLTRVNLCKALLNDPEVLFLDEPTASLDPNIAAKVRQTLLRVHRERRVTMIYTSHNMQEVQRMCHRVLFLSRGRIVSDGSPQEMVQRARAESLEDVFISMADAEERGGRFGPDAD
jgi:ABC-2 type transport system ATP-binding protein